MINKGESTLEGRFSGYLNGENVEVFDCTFNELTEYHENHTTTICLGRLLEHIHKSFGYENVFAYLIKRDTMELLYRMPKDAKTDAAAKNLETHLPDYSDAGEEITQCEGGYLWTSRTVPVICSPESYVGIYFLNRRKAVTKEFEEQWLRILLRSWFDSFEGKIQEFRSALSEFKQSSGPATNVFEKAGYVHPWLRSSELCELCEIALEKIETKGQNIEEELGKLEEKIKELGAKWHCCLDRSWPCDDGDGFGEEQYGPLNWYLSRISEMQKGCK